MIGNQAGLRPVLESIFHRMLTCQEKGLSLEALKALKEVIHHFALYGAFLVNESPNGQLLPSTGQHIKKFIKRRAQHQQKNTESLKISGDLNYGLIWDLNI